MPAWWRPSLWRSGCTSAALQPPPPTLACQQPVPLPAMAAPRRRRRRQGRARKQGTGRSLMRMGLLRTGELRQSRCAVYWSRR